MGVKKCKRLIAIHKPKKGFLGGPKSIKFDYMLSDKETINIDIVQIGIRKIILSSDKDIKTKDLYETYINLEKLIMLFEGSFIYLQELKFENSSTLSDEELDKSANYYMKKRLPYYNTVDFCKSSSLKLLDFENVLSEQLLKDWNALLKDLGIIYQVILYFTMDNHMPIDLRCAFFVEASESMVELVKQRKSYFTNLNPGGTGTSLRKCLKELIVKCGDDIFDIERANKKRFDKILTIMKDSRVRIMHIKRKQTEPYLNNKESLLYTSKLLLLYRKIIFDLLGIDYNIYRSNLTSVVGLWDTHQNILNEFLNKLK